jgi:hypothetical protein
MIVAGLAAALIVTGGCGLVRGGDDESGGASWSDPDASGPAPTVPAAPAEPPEVKPNAVLRPRFDTTEGEVNAGTAFVLSLDGSYLLVTAYHLFGPSGGMSRAIPAGELPDVVRRVTATSSDDENVVVSSDRLVKIPGASAFIPGDSDTPTDVRPDVAAFRLGGPGEAGVLELADEPARKGDRVYLLAELQGSDARLHPATVNGTGETAVSYRFDDRVELRGSSGGPILNADGEVLGINAAGGDADGQTYGLCGPLAALREKLTAGLG